MWLPDWQFGETCALSALSRRMRQPTERVRDMRGKRGKVLPVKPAGWLWRRRGLLMCCKKRGEMTVTRLSDSPRERFRRFNGLRSQEAGTQHRCEPTVFLGERNCCAAIFGVLPRRRPDCCCCGVRAEATAYRAESPHQRRRARHASVPSCSGEVSREAVLPA